MPAGIQTVGWFRPGKAVWGDAAGPWPVPTAAHCPAIDCPSAGPHHGPTPCVRMTWLTASSGSAGCRRRATSSFHGRTIPDSVGNLHQIAHRPPGFHAAQAHPGLKYPGVASGGFDHAQQHADGGCFPGPVQAQKSVNFTLGDAQRKILDRMHVPVAFSQPLCSSDCRFMAGSFLLDSGAGRWVLKLEGHHPEKAATSPGADRCCRQKPF